jgi:polyphosphate kinase
LWPSAPSATSAFIAVHFPACGASSERKQSMSKKKGKKTTETESVEIKNGSSDYAKELARLQIELAHLQAWVRKTGSRIVVVFEGRDAAGKGGIIKRITERVSPRVFRVVALPAPTDREKSQIYMQRYIAHLPAAGEVVILDRSWYNRAGVERVMGFCTEAQARRFLELAPQFERAVVDSGITLLKYFLDVTEPEQERRFRQRIVDPLRQWKLSPMDLESYRRWWDYTQAYDEMIRMTDSPHAPWWIVPSDDKKRARINCISHLLGSIPYERVPFEKPRLGKRQKRPADFIETKSFFNAVPDVF